MAVVAESCGDFVGRVRREHDDGPEWQSFQGVQPDIRGVRRHAIGFIDDQYLPAGHYLTINVTGILTGCTLELELVAVTVIVKVPGGVPGGGGGGGGGVEPPPQPMQSSTANAPVAKTQRGMCLLALSR